MGRESYYFKQMLLLGTFCELILVLISNQIDVTVAAVVRLIHTD